MVKRVAVDFKEAVNMMKALEVLELDYTMERKVETKQVVFGLVKGTAHIDEYEFNIKVGENDYKVQEDILRTSEMATHIMNCKGSMDSEYASSDQHSSEFGGQGTKF